MTCLRGLDHDQHSIVQYQPFFVEADRNHSMNCLAFDVANDDELQIIGVDPDFAEYDVFYNSVILTVAGADGERRKRR